MGRPGRGAVDHAKVFAALPTAYLVLDPDLVVVDANEAYLRLVGRTRDELVGRPVFEAFPPAPDALDDSGVSHVQRSFERARDTGRTDTMPIQRYDILDPRTGEDEERFWSLISVPVLDEQGATVLLLQRTEDVSDYLRERDRSRSQLEQSEVWRRRVTEAETDLYARAQELQAARLAEARASRQLAALADVALQLAQAQSVEELTAVVVDRGLAALEADGGALAVREGDTLALAISAGLGERTPERYGRLPLDGPLPGSVSVRTGSRVLLAGLAESLAFSEDMRQVVEDTGCVAWVSLPLVLKDQPLGSLTVGWSQERVFEQAELDVLDALAVQCAHGLLRIQSRQAERAVSAAAQHMAQALQRSLLTEPPELAGLQIAVRYRPAAQEAQVGGDWYDAFGTSDGTTCLVIGDVAGHDRDAAAAMGQLRNLLRGLAYEVPPSPGGQAHSPARVLRVLDRAMRDLAVGVLATGVLATLGAGPAAGAGAGAYRLRWSNAGHPPPLLLSADGTARLLQTPPDLLLGLDPDSGRTDHEVSLRPGETLLLYTDGLVERRGESLDEGLARLQDAVLAVPGASATGPAPEELCDALVDLVQGSAEDDIALLAVRIEPVPSCPRTTGPA